MEGVNTVFPGQNVTASKDILPTYTFLWKKILEVQIDQFGKQIVFVPLSALLP